LSVINEKFVLVVRVRSLEQIRSKNKGVIRKSKIICTLGPACWTVERLGDLIDAGMNVARFNFSHGDHAGHFACLQRLREALSTRPEAHCAVLLGSSFVIL
jgi:pyruvate kinase